MFKKLLLVFIALFSVILFASCKYEEKNKAIESITINDNSFKSTLEVGEDIDYNSLPITIMYKDGESTTKTVSELGATVTKANVTQPGITYFTVTYRELTITKIITVTKPLASITGIEVVTGSYQTSVIQNSEYYYDGIQIKVHYNDNTNEIMYLTSNGGTYSSIDTSVLGNKIITVKFNNFTDTISVEVIRDPKDATIVTSLALPTDFDNEYFIGEVVDYSKIYFVATYKDGHKENIFLNASGVEVSPAISTLAKGTAEYTIKFSGLNVKANINVIEKSVVGIEVVANSFVTSLRQDASPVYNGTIKVLFNDGSTENITTGFTHTDYTTTEVGMKTFTISYQGYSVDVNVNVIERDVVVTSISLADDFNGTFYQGDVVSKGNLKVKVNYNNGTYVLKSLLDSDISLDKEITTAELSAGYNVTITYGAFSCVATIKVLKVEVTSIEVVANSFVTTYRQDDTPIYTGTIKVYYNNGTSARIEEGFTYTTLNTSVIGNTSFTVSYEGFDATVNVKVIEKEVVISSISLADDFKDVYYQGDVVNLSSLKIKINYSNDTFITKNLNDASVSLSTGIVTSAVSAGYEVTITYGTFTCKATIVVNEVVATGIEVVAGTFTTSYREDDVANYNGSIKVNYNNGTSQVVTEGFTHTDVDTSVVGNTSFTVSYLGFDALVNVTIIEKLVVEESISLNDGFSAAYYVGDTADLSALSIKVNYNNSTYVVKYLNDSEVSISPAISTSAAGTFNFTISYKTFECQASYTVTALQIVDFSIKEIVNEFRRDDVAAPNAILTVVYNSGATEEVSTGITYNVNTSVVGVTTMVVTYAGIDKNVQVNILEKLACIVKSIELDAGFVSGKISATQFTDVDLTGLKIKVTMKMIIMIQYL